MTRRTLAILVALAILILAVLAMLFAEPAHTQASPVRAARYGDGLRVTWPAAARACVFRARDGQPLTCATPPWRQAWQDTGLLVRVGETVEVRRLDGSVIGRAVVRAVTYLPLARR